MHWIKSITGNWGLIINCFFIIILCLTTGCSSKEQNTLTISPLGANAKDAIISRAYPKNNYGKHDFLHLLSRIKSDSIIDDNRILIYFDVDTLPFSSTIDSAFVYLTPNGRRNYGEIEFQVERIIEPWSDEMVNWENQPKSESSDLIYFDEIPDDNNSSFKINVTPFIKGFLKKDFRNLGFLIKFIEEDQSDKRLTFFSGDITDNLNCPILKIYYK